MAGLTIAVATVALRGGGEASEPVSGVDHGRLGEWGVALDAMAEHPLTGAGADSYSLAASDVGGGSTLYAHNLPLEIWAELGPLGLALVIALFASTAALVWRLRGDRRAWLLAPAVLAFPLANLVDWTWHLAGAAALWAAALGALLALDTERREGQSISSASA
jgi:O-antigen ligase